MNKPDDTVFDTTDQPTAGFCEQPALDAASGIGSPSSWATGEATPPPVHRADARLAARLATKLEGDAALARIETTRKGLEGARVLYSPRTREYGHGGKGAPSAVLPCVVARAHNDEAADLVHVDADGIEHAFASCFIAGARDTKPGDPGTFTVVG